MLLVENIDYRKTLEFKMILNFKNIIGYHWSNEQNELTAKTGN